ncbi:hypothetical protein AAG570_011830 [Ranatra chinensis]|uniref:BRCA2 OB1 domain-containing protein n=1 Tax=Ranatra chinensis TaxID=642074 RepID=A0ABD0YHG5_9HEMI
MNSLVTRGSVAVGTKLLVWSAELINCPHGCDPLEVGSDVRLKLSTNCCRRVRWWTRLGAAPAPPPKIRLSSVLPGGGFVAKLVATIARAYPVLYMSKDSEGKTGK